MLECYVLDKNKNPILVDDVVKAASFFGNIKNRRVDKTKLSNGKLVSSVFLCFEHGTMNGKPILFETMVFNKSGKDVDCRRSCSWKDAKKIHQKMISKWAKNGS